MGPVGTIVPPRAGLLLAYTTDSSTDWKLRSPKDDLTPWVFVVFCCVAKPFLISRCGSQCSEGLDPCYIEVASPTNTQQCTSGGVNPVQCMEAKV